MEGPHVCMFGSELAPSRDDVYIGGSVVSAVNLAQYLDEVGMAVSAYTTRPRDWEHHQPEVEAEWGKITVADLNAKNVESIRDVTAVLSLVRGLVDHCRRHDVDILHGHSGFPVVAAIPVITGSILDIPVFHSLYCPVPEWKSAGLKKRLSSPFFARHILGRTERTFAMTENVYQSLMDIGLTNTSVLRPIVDCEAYHADLPKPESIEVASNKFTVLFVGNLKREKGLQYLIDAVGAITDDVPVQLIITTERDFAGADERKREIEEQIERHGFEDSVDWLGIISDMPQLISAADVLAVPFTSTDGPSDYPLAALEAMACETPVIGSAVGGIEELLSDGRGTLVPARDVDALADALRSVQRDAGPDVQRTREFVETTFSANEIYSEISTSYEEQL